MSNLRNFRTFDPVSGDIPYYPFSYLPDIASRARALLKGRNAIQIDSVVGDINISLVEYFHFLKVEEIERLQRNGFSYDEECDDLDIPTAENTNEVDALKSCINWWIADSGLDFTDWQQHELFAALSLSLLAKALSMLCQNEGNFFSFYPVIRMEQAEKPQSSEKSSDISILVSASGAYSLIAMDAVCHAEHLQEVKLLIAQNALLLSMTHDNYQRKDVERDEEECKRRDERAKALSAARHVKTNQAKAIAVKEWEKNVTRFSSGEKAGKYFADWLLTQGFTFEPRTVTGWIRTHAKKIGVRFR